jgi:hypothetical protein
MARPAEGVEEDPGDLLLGRVDDVSVYMPET